MDWACLAVGVVAAVLSLSALVPLRGALGSALSFVPSWVVGEAPLHLAVAVVAAVLACGLLGGFSSALGWAGLALALLACAGLGAQFASGLRSRRYFEAALSPLSVGRGRWAWTTVDTRRVVVAFPLRPRAVERLRDIAYADGSERAHRLDLYRRAGPGESTAAPVILYFHGGTWVMGDKREQGIPMLEYLAERGFVCVTANYALSPKARWPRHILDCKLALLWVKRHIAEYGGDPNLVFVSGCSAGGHLAALLALTANEPAWQPGYENEDTSVAGCAPLYGVYDFVDEAKIANVNLTPILHRYVFEQAALEDLSAASPLLRAHQGAPPFFVVHGRADVLVPVETARAFVRTLRAQSTQFVTYAELPLTQHGFDNFWSPRTVHFVHALERFTEAIIATRAAEREVGR
jgi:acetyl esterase/lipase